MCALCGMKTRMPHMGSSGHTVLFVCVHEKTLPDKV